MNLSVPGVGRVLRFFHSDDSGLLYVAVADLALYLQDVARMERDAGHEACANIVAGCALSLLEGVGPADMPPEPELEEALLLAAGATPFVCMACGKNALGGRCQACGTYR